MAENKKQQGGPKGFAGFQEHVSDVDSLLQEPEPSTESKPDIKKATEPNNYPPDSILANETPTPPRSTVGTGTHGRRIDKKMLGVVVGIAFVVGMALFGNEKKVDAPSPSPQAPSGYNTPSEPAYNQEPQQPSPPTRIQDPYAEEIPPIGTDLILNRAQITYCRAEKVRIGAMRLAVDDYDHGQVDALNSRVRDYNNRCSNFRYKEGLLQSVEADIEPRRAELEEEGRNLLLR